MSKTKAAGLRPAWDSTATASGRGLHGDSGLLAMGVDAGEGSGRGWRRCTRAQGCSMRERAEEDGRDLRSEEAVERLTENGDSDRGQEGE